MTVTQRAAPEVRPSMAPSSLVLGIAAVAVIAFFAGLLAARIPELPGPAGISAAVGVVCWLGAPAAIVAVAVGRSSLSRWLALFPGAAVAFATALALYTAYLDPLGTSGAAVFTGMFVFVLVPQALLLGGVGIVARLRVLSRRRV